MTKATNTRPRDRIVDVSAATRSVLTRAATADEPLRPRTWRVLAGVLALTSTWSRLSDTVRHAQLAAVCGIDDRDTLRRELRELTRRELITYTPGTGRRPSIVGLPAPGDPGEPAGVSPPSARRGQAPVSPQGTSEESVPRTLTEEQEPSTTDVVGRCSSLADDLEEIHLERVERDYLDRPNGEHHYGRRLHDLGASVTDVEDRYLAGASAGDARGQAIVTGWRARHAEVCG